MDLGKYDCPEIMYKNSELHTHVHWNIIYNTHDMEATLNVHQWMNVNG